MEYIKTFNKAEKEIYYICCKDEIDYDKIDFLLKHGASANAVEIIKYDDEIEEELLLTQCWLDGIGIQYDEERNKKHINEDFYIRILKIFIDNGLNVDKYVNHIFEYIQYTYDTNYFIEMTKLILNSLKGKNNLDLDKSLSSIGMEESYQNCCMANHEYANILSTVYEMIEGYINGKDINKMNSCKSIIGDTIEEVKIYYKDLKVDMCQKFISDSFDIFIKCNKNTLCIKNEYIFVDNNSISSEYEETTKKAKEENSLEGSNEVFIKHINEYLKNETINNINFYNEHVEKTKSTFLEITRIEIDITNNKKMIINLDESYSNMKITIK